MRQEGIRELVAEVAAAYFSNSSVGVVDIPRVIEQIAASLQSVGDSPVSPVATQGADELMSAVAQAPRDPAGRVPPRSLPTAQEIEKSILPDKLISFEDGRTYKILRRHLASRGLNPVSYREKWGLPDDYPMVAPRYSEERSEMAKAFGLGRGRKAKPTRRAGGKVA
jgi:predicted transcriptional regulator